jgi:RNase P/RNase MRP subunit p29
MRSIENILYHEWIGLKIKLSECSQSSLTNLSGQIIFETKNMLIVRTLNGIKKIPKKNYTQMYFISSFNRLLYKR